MKKTKKQTKPVSKKKAVTVKQSAGPKKKSGAAVKSVKAKTAKIVNKKVSKAVKDSKPKVTKTKVAAKKGAAVQGTVMSSVLTAVKRNKNGLAVAKIKEKTGLGPRQLSNALYKLSKSGRIAKKERGVYIAK
jgi:predicted Rossmann fold nucleotide-binding protein DprA/Smf involved in DNA uptake